MNLVSKRKQKMPLRSQILLRTVPLAVLLWVLVSLYPASQISGELHRQIKSQLDAETTYLRHIVDEKLQTSLAACDAIAKNDVIVNAIIDQEHRESTLRSFIKSIRMPGAAAVNVVMTDFKGHPIASKEPIGDPERYAQQDWLKPLLAGNFVVRVDEGLLTIGQPVIYGQSPEAAMVVTYDLAEYTCDFGVGTESSVSRVLYNNQVISQAGGVRAAASGSLGTEKWMQQSLPVRLLPGLSVAVAKSDEVVQRALDAVQRAMIIETIGALVVLILGIWFATSLVISNVNRLVSVIDDVRSNKNMDRRVEVGASAEFEKLGDRFNCMLDEIQRTTVTKEEYRIPALVARYTDSSVVVTCADGKIEWVNEGFTAITGYPWDEVIGLRPGDFLQGPDTDAAAVAKIRAAIRDKRGVNVELINYRKNGDKFWVAIEIRPIYSAAGEVENFIAIQNDITARVNAEIEKDQLNQKLVDMSRRAGMAEVASGVLHNVGNAVNSVNVSASLLKTNIANSKSTSVSKVAHLIAANEHQLPEFFEGHSGRHFPAYIKALADSIEQENERNFDELSNIINSIEHIKHIVSKQQQNAGTRVIQEELCFAELVDEAVRIRHELIADHCVHVARSADEVPHIVADRHMVLEILVNLIGNAVNAVEGNELSDRRVSVSIVTDGDATVSCVIQDNGVGISRENLDKIFGHGFTTRAAGNGFGLHSSILAAKSLGGSIDVASDGPGHGAIFTLRLPASEPKRHDEESSVHRPKFRSMRTIRH